MFSRLRGLYGRLLTPGARLLTRLGVTPSAVTVLGTVLVCVLALTLLPAGRLASGSALILLALLGDGLDGTMARLSGRETRFGAFLDSTLDRVADAAIFCGLSWWAFPGRPAVAATVLAALVTGCLVSYARARAEAEGWDASVGLFERTDRLVVTLAAAFAVGVGAPDGVLVVALGIVAVGSAVTVGQRIGAALRAARAQTAAATADATSASVASVAADTTRSRSTPESS